METTGRVTYHVRRADANGWNVVDESSGRAGSAQRSRTDTILQRRNLATSHPYSLLVVHDREGQIENQYNYARRPREAIVGSRHRLRQRRQWNPFLHKVI